MKHEYNPPELENLGTLEELTLGNTPGSTLDADFLAGNLFGELTTSN